ncbi:SRPBCC family protein [Microbacterium awajiense]|uniref:SRPBCC family protein n=1 Tax=Microbacterium awajiense TaxID=415214 RepID=A0ABP7ANQ4_9MICO
MTPTATATGRREVRDGAVYIVFERTFRAPRDDVWAAVTEPHRLERWIGTWSGDPTTGSVEFRMTAEDPDAAPETHRILLCDPPRRLVTESTSPDDDTTWRIELDLTEERGVTTFRFAQRMEDAVPAETVGPGWDYYLDRLVVAHGGGDAAMVEWDAYYPALSNHYAEMFGR